MSLTDNLVAYFKLDEASGNALDAVGSNNLTDNNTVASATGKIGNCRDFEKANSESFTHTSNSTFQCGDIDFTFTAWLKLESKPVDGMGAINKADAADLEYGLGYDPGSDRLNFGVCGSSGFGDSATAFADSLGSPSTGVWYFVVGWHDSVANTVNVQINDGTVDSVSHSTGVYVGSMQFCISWPEYDNYWDGLIDEVGFWKRVLTSGERTSLYNGGAGLAYPFSAGAANPVFGMQESMQAEPALLSW